MRTDKHAALRRCVIAGLLGFAAVLSSAPSASAQGLVITARPPGEAGLQSDAVRISPRNPLPSLPADLPLERIQFWPWPPTQGETVAVWLRVRSPGAISLAVGAQSFPVTSDGTSAWGLIPIPALAPAESQHITITVGGVAEVLQLPIAAGVFQIDQIPTSASDPIYSRPEEMAAELAKLTGLFAGRSPAGWSPRSRYQSPLEGEYPSTSPYGTRRTYGDGLDPSAHTGEDFGAPAGTAVSAPADGIIVLAEPLFVRGNAVVVDHGSGVFTGYWHLSRLDVQAGQRVVVGQRLGEVGSTGLSTGAHLHWEMRVAGVAVTPLQWLTP